MTIWDGKPRQQEAFAPLERLLQPQRGAVTRGVALLTYLQHAVFYRDDEDCYQIRRRTKRSRSFPTESRV